ncbi:MAG: polymer-forming cytoskeletal protein [Pyrinomonadaceae bacterium]
MIRMGRNNTNIKPETSQQPEDSTFDVNKNGQQFGFASQTSETPPFRTGNGETAPNSNRVYTDSESITRDIKEGRLSGFIGSGTSLTGETDFKSMLRVDGHLIGKITSESGTLYVGSGGLVDANVSVAATVVHGTINGDIIASERIELGRTAKVVGNIQTPSLVMEQGAILEGNCSMMQAKSNFDKRPVQNFTETVKQERETAFPTKTEAVVVAPENEAGETVS